METIRTILAQLDSGEIETFTFPNGDTVERFAGALWVRRGVYNYQIHTTEDPALYRISTMVPISAQFDSESHALLSLLETSVK